jgi:two-component system, NarL family, nitrate/nitrite response regulator NarL
MTTIILADDHELIREAVKPYIGQLGEGISIWEAATYGDVLTLAKKASEASEVVPIALIDLHMPGNESGDPFGGLKRICLSLPETAVVIFSSNEDSQTIATALQNGARGYITKTTRGRSLLNALKLVLEGEIYVPQSLVKDVFTSLPSTSPLEPSKDGLSALLSPREAHSLRLLIKGMTNKEIARELGLQDVTIKMHLRNAYRKIGATNRIEAVRMALERQFE